MKKHGRAHYLGSVSRVTTVNTTVVKPVKTFDLHYLAFYNNQRLMLYNGSNDFNEIVRKMNDGLATVFEDFIQLGKDEEGICRKSMTKTAMMLALTWRFRAAEIGVNDVFVQEGIGGIMKDLLSYNEVEEIRKTWWPVRQLCH